MSTPSLPTLRSERLILSHAGLASPHTILSFYKANHSHFSPTAPKTPEGFYTLPYWEEQIANSITDFSRDASVRFVLSLTSNPGRVIGAVNFTQIVRGPLQACYLGYGISEECSNQGLMSEALRVAIAYMFEVRNLHRIMANYLVDNAASARVLEKLGFKVEGIAEKYLHINGQWRDHVLTSLTNENWTA